MNREVNLLIEEAATSDLVSPEERRVRLYFKLLPTSPHETLIPYGQSFELHHFHTIPNGQLFVPLSIFSSLRPPNHRP